MKRVVNFVVILFVGLFLISFAISLDSTNSSTMSNYTLAGCNFDFDGGTIGVYKNNCSSSPAAGLFFCDADGGSWITAEEGLGCSMGNPGYLTGDNGEYCCPSGSFCNKTGDETFQCTPRLDNCFNQMDFASCTDSEMGCIWLNETDPGVCVDGIRDLGCGYYNSSETCVTDAWSLGQVGIGTELCGTLITCNGKTFTVPDTGCSCSWYPVAPEGKHCQINLVGIQKFSSPGTDPDKFNCSNAFSLGNCTDGQQPISWTSSNSTISGFSNNNYMVTEDCLDALNCNGGEATRFCGEPIVKLPGFSLFALFSSLLVIGMYYFIRKEYSTEVSK